MAIADPFFVPLTIVMVLLGCNVLASPPVGSVTVFRAGESGYACFRIPSLLKLSSGTLLAFAEARRPTCADNNAASIVVKRSINGGVHWGALQWIVNASTHGEYVGNPAPVESVLPSGSRRVVLPYTRSNRAVNIAVSDDEGISWQMLPGDVSGVPLPGQTWVGTGPPGSIRLSPSGRMLIPCYTMKNGETANAFALISDDPEGNPASWSVGGVAPGPLWTDESQAVDLGNGNVLIASRGNGTSRMQVRSFDGGRTYGVPIPVSIPETIGGVEGSIVKIENGTHPILFFSGTTGNPIRYNLTLFKSTDQGVTWKMVSLIDNGPTAYSSLVDLSFGETMRRSTLGLLYESWNASTTTLLTYLTLNV